MEGHVYTLSTQVDLVYVRVDACKADTTVVVHPDNANLS